MDSDTRKKFDMQLERELNQHMVTVREHMYDFVHLYVRRNGKQLNGMEVDLVLLEEILKIAKMGFDDGKASKIQFYADRMKPVVDSFVEATLQDSKEPIAPKPFRAE
jgi:hypothetical protein